MKLTSSGKVGAKHRRSGSGKSLFPATNIILVETPREGILILRALLKEILAQQSDGTELLEIRLSPIPPEPESMSSRGSSTRSRAGTTRRSLILSRPAATDPK